MKPTAYQLELLRRIGATESELAGFVAVDASALDRISRLLEKLPAEILAGSLAFVYLAGMGEAAALEQCYRMHNMKDRADTLLGRRGPRD